MPDDHSASGGPLQGLVVVEAGQLIAGPFCGQLLGDMGATVIKIEPPGRGDPMRAWGQGAPVWWEVIARNKRSVSIDLRKPAGQALARRLAARADVLIENFRPGTMEGWGLGPEALHADNPGLIMVRMSGYGQDGPYAERAGFGGIGEAMGGWRAIVGEPDRPPARMGVSIGDSLTATFGCMRALAALEARRRTGRGQVVDCALYESVLQVMESLVPEYAATGVARTRSGAVLPGVAPSNVYPCRDGEYLIGANGDGVFRRLCTAMGRPELADDPRYADHLARGACQAELDDIIAAWTRGFSVDELDRLMTEHGVPAGRIYGPADMLADPHFAARQALVAFPEHPRWPGLVMQNAFPRFSATPSSVRTIAPQAVGEDNAAVLAAFAGVDEAELKRLRADGIV
jgi:crotonobetainyl-CoA:carnitine CoA-transferase CaiB-like acyl-CoA transferase